MITPAAATNLLNLAALIALMLGTGLQVNFQEVVAVLRDKRAMVLGLTANYLLVPLITTALLCAFHAQPMGAAGILVLAVCPGAPVGPPLTKISKGNVALSTALMLFLSTLSAILCPLLLVLLLGCLFPGTSVNIDAKSIVSTLLIAQLAPLAAGMIIGRRSPRVAQLLSTPIDKVGKLLFIVVLGLIITSQLKTMLLLEPRVWLGMITLLIASLSIGWLCGGRSEADRKAMTLTTASRNAGVGLVIVLSNFSGTPAIPALVIYSLLSIGACVIISLLWSRR